jgi:hypothetical protein
MTWDSTKIADLLVDCKTLSVRLALAIIHKMDLGQPVDGYLDDFYLACNVTFSVDEYASDFVDADFDYLYSLYTKLQTKHNRYKGLSL